MGSFDFNGALIELKANQTAPMVRAICKTTGMKVVQVLDLVADALVPNA
jgi:hypothetical protein